MKQYALKVWLRDVLIGTPPNQDISSFEVGSGTVSGVFYCDRILVSAENDVTITKVGVDSITVLRENIGAMTVSTGLPEKYGSGNTPVLRPGGENV